MAEPPDVGASLLAEGLGSRQSLVRLLTAIDFKANADHH
jgi:hypothetical protein